MLLPHVLIYGPYWLEFIYKSAYSHSLITDFEANLNKQSNTLIADITTSGIYLMH